MISIKQEPGEQTQRREADPQAPREANTAEARGIGRDSKGRCDPTWGQRHGHWRNSRCGRLRSCSDLCRLENLFLLLETEVLGSTESLQGGHRKMCLITSLDAKLISPFVRQKDQVNHEGRMAHGHVWARSGPDSGVTPVKLGGEA